MIEGFIIHFLIILMGVIISVLAFNLIAGYTGQLNLGFAAVGVAGAYVSALLSVKAGFPIYLSVLIAAIFTALLSVLIGLPTNKVKKEYFHLASVGFIFILGGIVKNWISLTDGALGIKGIPRIVNSNLNHLIIMVFITLISFLIIRLIVKSHLGRIFQGIRDDELAVQTLGYDTYKYKLLAFAISGFFVGLSWALWAHYATFIDPTLFNITEILMLLAMIILGGLASLYGSIFGAAIVFFIPQALRFIGISSSAIGPIREMLFALILILVLVYRPRGLLGKADIQ